MNGEILYRGYFTLIRTEGKREVLLTTDAVAVLVACPRLRKIYLQGQDRDAMITPQNPTGYTVEVCAGRFDKPGESPRVAAARETGEELGIVVGADAIQLVSDEPLATSAGMTNEHILLAYTEVEPEQILEGTYWGAADENERTTRIEISYDDIPSYRTTDIKTFALIQWFLRARLERSKGKSV